MKIKKGVKLRTMRGKCVAVSVDNSGEGFNGMITLNDSAELMWRKLEQGADEADLVRLLCDEYGISPEEAAEDSAAFIAKLEEMKLLVK